MLSAGAWKLNQQNLIKFVMVDGLGNEVLGLGGNFSLELSKNTGGMVAGLGSKGEIGRGHYYYLTTTADANTVGAVSIAAWGAGTIQQNLEYVIEQRTPLSVSFTYTVTDTATSLPLDGVCVVFTTDSAGNNIVWTGFTDALGVARDDFGQLPRLDPGTYFVHRSLSGYTFATDTEVVA